MQRQHARWLINVASVVVLIVVADRLAAHGEGLGHGILATLQSYVTWANSGMFTDILYTCSRVTLGFSIAVVLGIAVGLLTGRHAEASGGVANILNYLRAITPVALAPFFLVAFGISETSKILLVSWGAFFPVWINAHLGVKSLPSELVASAKLIGLSGWRMIRHFYLPATLGAAYPGARVAIGVSFILVYISETLGAAHGVGYRLGVAYSAVQMARMMAALLLLGALGLIADRLFVTVVRHLTPWIAFERVDASKRT